MIAALRTLWDKVAFVGLLGLVGIGYVLYHAVGLFFLWVAYRICAHILGVVF